MDYKASKFLTPYNFEFQLEVIKPIHSSNKRSSQVLRVATSKGISNLRQARRVAINKDINSPIKASHTNLVVHKEVDTRIQAKPLLTKVTSSHHLSKLDPIINKTAMDSPLQAMGVHLVEMDTEEEAEVVHMVVVVVVVGEEAPMDQVVVVEMVAMEETEEVRMEEAEVTEEAHEEG